MENQVQKVDKTQQSHLAKIVAIGGVIGAVVGVVASLIFIKNIDEPEDREFTPATGVKLGLAVMGLFRILAG